MSGTGTEGADGTAGGAGIDGVAGLLIACPDPARMRDWYGRHLGLHFAEGEGARFAWRRTGDGTPADTRLDFVPKGSDPFAPGTQPFGVSYHVRDLEALARALRDEGDDVSMPSPQAGWIVDPEGQRVELVQAGESAAPARDHGRVDGIGGVFFRSPDPAALKAWYARLGIRPGADGYVTFPVTSAGGGETVTVWEVFPAETTYFDSKGEPSPHPWMLNLRVRDLDGLVASLREDGVWVDPNTEAYEYGTFAWILDPAGARIELWEPASPT